MTSVTSATASGKQTAASTPDPKRPSRGIVNEGPVLLATEGFGISHAPALAARLIATHLERPLHVVTVIEPITVYAGTAGLAPMPVLLDESFASTREENVRHALSAVWPAEATYTLDTRFGPVAGEIASASRELEASMIVVGAAPRHRRKHVISGVLASQVLRHVRCPVLSVVPGLDYLPRQVVAAVDFSPGSVRAAREALRILDDAGTLTLAYAIPMVHAERLLPTLAGELGPDEALQLLRQLRDHLQRWAPPGRTIQVRVLDGIADDGIIGLAASLDADLISAGTHGPGLFERMFIGSIASNILHAAPCSVLVAPPPDATERIELGLDAWGTVESIEEHLWGAMLDDFTRRNANRTVRVEVDDLSFGAQVQATGYRLRGATFDPRDRRVDLMLGTAREGAGHLTRTIPRVHSIAMTRDATGQERALQIRAEQGETLVVFER